MARNSGNTNQLDGPVVLREKRGKRPASGFSPCALKNSIIVRVERGDDFHVTSLTIAEREVT
jgi:hypothetical protein